MENTHDHHRRVATAWAAQALTQRGFALHAWADGPGWDIETPHGWVTAENWQELCRVARKLLNG